MSITQPFVTIFLSSLGTLESLLLMQGRVSPFWKYAFIQIHKYTVIRLDFSVESTFHVPMSSKWLHNVSSTAELCCQLNRFEIDHILAVKEHKSNYSCFRMDLEWMPAQSDSLDDQAIRVRIQNRARGDQLLFSLIVGTEYQHRSWWKRYWRVNCCNHSDIISQKSLVLKFA